MSNGGAQEGFLSRLVTPLLDVLTLFIIWLTVPALTAQFARLNGLNLLIVIVGYTLLCIGVFIGNQLAPRPVKAKPVEPSSKDGKDKPDKPADTAGTCAKGTSVPFAIFVCVMLFYGGGMFENHGFLSQMNDGAPALVAVFGTLSVIIALMLYPLAVFLPGKPRVAWGTPTHALLRALAVLCINTMVIITTAFWQYFMADAELGEMALRGKILVFICFYIVMLIFYAPPRIALVALEPSRWGLWGFLVFLGVIVFRMMMGGG